MEVMTITKTIPTESKVYKAFDGKVFDSYNACYVYEQKHKLSLLKEKFDYKKLDSEDTYSATFVYHADLKNVEKDLPEFLSLLVYDYNNYSSLGNFGFKDEYDPQNILKTLESDVKEWKDGETYKISMWCDYNNDSYDDLYVKVLSKEKAVEDVVDLVEYYKGLFGDNFVYSLPTHL